MPCECTLAGFCTRHGVVKSAEWVALCRTRPDYFRVWETGHGPGQPVDPEKAKEFTNWQEQKNKANRKLWLELHTKQHATPEWFANWCYLVPLFGCGCQSWLRNYLVTNPPRYDDWFAWTVELHNAVNRKLYRKEWTIEEAATRWAGAFAE